MVLEISAIILLIGVLIIRKGCETGIDGLPAIGIIFILLSIYGGFYLTGTIKVVETKVEYLDYGYNNSSKNHIKSFMTEGYKLICIYEYKGEIRLLVTKDAEKFIVARENIGFYPTPLLVKIETGYNSYGSEIYTHASIVVNQPKLEEFIKKQKQKELQNAE